MRLRWGWLLIVSYWLVWATLAWAAPVSTTIRSALVAELPPASVGNTGKIYMVRDASTDSTCVVGGGTYENFCQSTGTAWMVIPVSGSAASGGSAHEINAPRTPTPDTLNAAVAAAGTDVGRIVVDGTLPTTGPVTVLSTSTLTFRGAGQIACTSNVVTIVGQIEAPPGVQIFDSNCVAASRILFAGNTTLKKVYASWWGSMARADVLVAAIGSQSMSLIVDRTIDDGANNVVYPPTLTLDFTQGSGIIDYTGDSFYHLFQGIVDTNPGQQIFSGVGSPLGTPGYYTHFYGDRLITAHKAVDFDGTATEGTGAAVSSGPWIPVPHLNRLCTDSLTNPTIVRIDASSPTAVCSSLDGTRILGAVNTGSTVAVNETWLFSDTNGDGIYTDGEVLFAAPGYPADAIVSGAALTPFTTAMSPEICANSQVLPTNVRIDNDGNCGTIDGYLLAGDGSGHVTIATGDVNTVGPSWAFVDGSHGKTVNGTLDLGEDLYVDNQPVALYYASNALQKFVRASWWDSTATRVRMDRFVTTVGREPITLLIDRPDVNIGASGSSLVPLTTAIQFEPGASLSFTDAISQVFIQGAVLAPSGQQIFHTNSSTPQVRFHGDQLIDTDGTTTNGRGPDPHIPEGTLLKVLAVSDRLCSEGVSTTQPPKNVRLTSKTGCTMDTIIDTNGSLAPAVGNSNSGVFNKTYTEVVADGATMVRFSTTLDGLCTNSLTAPTTIWFDHDAGCTGFNAGLGDTIILSAGTGAVHVGKTWAFRDTDSDGRWDDYTTGTGGQAEDIYIDIVLVDADGAVTTTTPADADIDAIDAAPQLPMALPAGSALCTNSATAPTILRLIDTSGGNTCASPTSGGTYLLSSGAATVAVPTTWTFHDTDSSTTWNGTEDIYLNNNRPGILDTGTALVGSGYLPTTATQQMSSGFFYYLDSNADGVYTLGEPLIYNYNQGVVSYNAENKLQTMIYGDWWPVTKDGTGDNFNVLKNITTGMAPGQTLFLSAGTYANSLGSDSAHTVLMYLPADAVLAGAGAKQTLITSKNTPYTNVDWTGLTCTSGCIVRDVGMISQRPGNTLIDADGSVSGNVGSGAYVELLNDPISGQQLYFFTDLLFSRDHLCANSLTALTKLYQDGTGGGGDCTPGNGGVDLQLIGADTTGATVHIETTATLANGGWAFHDVNGDGNWDNGEDIYRGDIERIPAAIVPDRNPYADDDRGDFLFERNWFWGWGVQIEMGPSGLTTEPGKDQQGWGDTDRNRTTIRHNEFEQAGGQHALGLRIFGGYNVFEHNYVHDFYRTAGSSSSRGIIERVPFRSVHIADNTFSDIEDMAIQHESDSTPNYPAEVSIRDNTILCPVASAYTMGIEWWGANNVIEGYEAQPQMLGSIHDNVIANCLTGIRFNGGYNVHNNQVYYQQSGIVGEYGPRQQVLDNTLIKTGSLTGNGIVVQSCVNPSSTTCASLDDLDIVGNKIYPASGATGMSSGILLTVNQTLAPQNVKIRNNTIEAAQGLVASSPTGTGKVDKLYIEHNQFIAIAGAGGITAKGVWLQSTITDPGTYVLNDNEFGDISSDAAYKSIQADVSGITGVGNIFPTTVANPVALGGGKWARLHPGQRGQTAAVASGATTVIPYNVSALVLSGTATVSTLTLPVGFFGPLMLIVSDPLGIGVGAGGNIKTSVVTLAQDRMLLLHCDGTNCYGQ